LVSVRRADYSIIKKSIKLMTFTAEAQRTRRKMFLSVGRCRQTKRNFFEEFETWTRPWELMENRYLLSEPEASEPVADSP
jgi:hypothetical protein